MTPIQPYSRAMISYSFEWQSWPRPLAETPAWKMRMLGHWPRPSGHNFKRGYWPKWLVDGDEGSERDGYWESRAVSNLRMEQYEQSHES